MIAPLPVDRFLAEARSTPVIDVRSPGEFAHGHIPGAFNIPLFDDDERARVGTRYKRAGRDAAVLTGLELIGPKLASFVKQSRKLSPDGEVLVHCWRGGMRSASFAWLLQTAGLRVAGTLQQGYKAFRQEALHAFEKPLPLVVLGGQTGSGKTEILHHLRGQGEQVVDLEGLARHKGSSFGAIGEAPQPTVEQFENDLFAALRGLDPGRRIWLEDESVTIGTVRIPHPFFAQMRRAPVLFLEVPKAERIERLVQMYTGCDDRLLAEAVHRIHKRLGGQHHARALQALAAGDYATVADVTLAYYDKAYLFGLAKRDPNTVHRLPVAGLSPAEIARRLVGYAAANITLSDASIGLD
ncbi:MAG: Selenophosphate-dependent tRNA 2-selenouridine synthase [uncultured Cytophagales bacterium]|uniref:Selenophosphate-dependent tRNA 2-selenouridine synthase n=1 Tax=uncultured Cytophagales bacterium TaxID=158755 RepID=A0A6J4K8N9_9SPHI|nr:MAG: Selenophosphate-dependent tRNA 2-selenouridine synthase [uncultured Cytophagales bacterium]